MRGARSVIVAACACTRAAASAIVGEWNACDDASGACATPRCAGAPRTRRPRPPGRTPRTAAAVDRRDGERRRQLRGQFVLRDRYRQHRAGRLRLHRRRAPPRGRPRRRARTRPRSTRRPVRRGCGRSGSPASPQRRPRLIQRVLVREQQRLDQRRVGGARVAQQVRFERQPGRPANRPHTSSSAARNTGCSRCRSRAIPAACAPCPVNRKITGRAGGASPVAGHPPAASASSAVSRDSATTNARHAWSCRAACSVCATSASAHSGWRRHAVARRSAARRSPSGVAADSRRQCAAAAVGASASGGAASRITCALVPPMPNELTAARRGVPPSGQSAASAVRRKAASSSSSSGLGVSKCSVPGTLPRSSASAALITPASPAALSRCPTLVLTAPSRRGARAGCWP